MKRKQLKKIYQKTLDVINRPLIEYEVNGVIFVKPAHPKDTTLLEGDNNV